MLAQELDFSIRQAPELASAPTALVVDDNLQIVQLLQSLLKGRVAACDTAGSVAEAEARLEHGRYDLVLVDLCLPDGSGVMILKKHLRRHPDTLFIVISGNHDLDTAVALMREGAYDYIAKPFELKEILERIQRVIEEWRSRRRYRYYEDNLDRMVQDSAAELKKSTLRVEEAYSVTVTALGAALGLKDPESEEHCRRVAENGVRLGRKLDLAGEALQDLEWGAYLHDIGKIGVPEHILLQPTPLSESQREVIRRHPAMGYRLLQRIRFLAGAREVVLYHHERYDGSGYPYGLRGDEIPLAAKVFAVVDAVDAMTSRRPYRKSLSLSAAISEVRAQTGRHFDPGVVETFLSIPVTEWRLQEAAERLAGKV